MSLPPNLITNRTAQLPGDYRKQPTAKGTRGENRSESAFMRLWDMMVSDLPKPTREYRFHDTRKWRLDFAWPDYKLAVEIDGGVHGIREKRGRDAEKSRALNDAEWRVQRYTSEDIRDMPVQVIEEVARILRERMTINSERKN